MTLRTLPIPVTAEGEDPDPALLAAVEVERAHHRELLGHADLVDSAEAVAASLRAQERARRLLTARPGFGDLVPKPGIQGPKTGTT